MGVWVGAVGKEVVVFRVGVMVIDDPLGVVITVLGKEGLGKAVGFVAELCCPTAGLAAGANVDCDTPSSPLLEGRTATTTPRAAAPTTIPVPKA